MATKKSTQVPGAAAPTSQSTDQPAEAPVATDGKELPNAEDIDPTKISKAVLTKQGWICPA